MSEHGEVAEGWRKSSTSDVKDCVEVRFGGQHVDVRNSRNRNGSVLTFSHGEWTAFLTAVRLGEFDIPPSPTATE